MWCSSQPLLHISNTHPNYHLSHFSLLAFILISLLCLPVRLVSQFHIHFLTHHCTYTSVCIISCIWHAWESLLYIGSPEQTPISYTFACLI